MTIQQLKYIVKVAETGNLTEASKQLFVSQPSLTNSIRKLEDELHITIFSRTNKGVLISSEGERFLSYARQILEQVHLVEEKYLNAEAQSPKFSVSCQHYAFAVNAFVDLIRQYDAPEYDFTIRETQTYEVIRDVSEMKSEIGILYINAMNEEAILKLLRQHGLKFETLFIAKPHVFISSKHPLAWKESLTINDLEDYPCLTFDQGDYNSFYYSEEILSTMYHRKNIRVHDRATLFNLAAGLNGYTITSGVLGADLNGEHIITKPLEANDYMQIGTITRKDIILSRYGASYMAALRKYIQQYHQKYSLNIAND